MENWPALNLPTYAYRLKKEEGNTFIFDIIRKKFILLTKEEWVRQHFINLLINNLGYPKGLTNVETGLSYFKNTKRSDITIKNRNNEFFMLIECKAPEVKLDRKTLAQISQYNKELKAEFISITNGLKHFIWKYTENGYEQVNQFPEFPKT